MFRLVFSLFLVLPLVAQTTYIGGSRIIEGTINAGVESGSGNAFVITTSADTNQRIKAYHQNVIYTFTTTHANTGVDPTLAVDGLTPTAMKRVGRGNLANGDITNNASLQVSYDGTYFQVLSIGSSSVVLPTGYSNVAPNSNTATTNKLVFIGDSHFAGVGQTTSVPAQVSPTDTYSVNNLAVSGTKFCAYWADNGANEAAVDALYNPLAKSNVLVVEGGGNDMIDNNTGTPAVPWITAQQVYDCQVSYIKRRKAVGWKVIYYGMYDRAQTGIGGRTGTQLHDDLNGLWNAGFASNVDAYVDISADAGVGADGTNVGGNFQSDHIHVVSVYTASLAAKITAKVNALNAGYANLPYSTMFQSPRTYVGSQIQLQNLNPNDFSGMEYRGDGISFLTATGNSSSSFANAFVMFDFTHGYADYTIDGSGQFHNWHTFLNDGAATFTGATSLNGGGSCTGTCSFVTGMNPAQLTFGAASGGGLTQDTHVFFNGSEKAIQVVTDSASTGEGVIIASSDTTSNANVSTRNNNASFAGVLGYSGHMQSATRSYFSALGGPSHASVANMVYLVDAGSGPFSGNLVWTIKDAQYKFGANPQFQPAAAKPTCDNTNGPFIRGTHYFTNGGTGVADKEEVCQKDASDNYSWVAH